MWTSCLLGIALGSLAVPQVERDEHLEGQLHRAVQIQRAVEEILLTPEERWFEEYAGLLARPDTGIGRILERKRGEEDLTHAMRIGPLACQYSFEHANHGEGNTTQIRVQAGRLDGGADTKQIAIFLDVGDVPLGSDLLDQDATPPTIDEDANWDWKLLRREALLSEGQGLREFASLHRKLGSHRITLNSTILLRSFIPGDHDMLVAMRVLERDERGITLAWRILRRFELETPGDSSESRGDFDRDPHAEVPDSSAADAQRSLPALLEELRGVRETARPLLLAPDPQVASEFVAHCPEFADGERRDLGFGRVLEADSHYAPLLDARGPVHRFDCLRGELTPGSKHDVSIDGSKIRAHRLGRSPGLILDLGAVSLDELPRVLAGAAPTHLNETELEARALLWELQLGSEGSGATATKRIPANDRADIDRLRLGDEVPAIPGHTYLVRTAPAGDAGRLLALMILDRDERGTTFAYRVLQTWPK